MRRSLYIATDVYEIFPRRDLRAKETPIRFPDEVVAFHFLHRLLSERWNQQVLRLTLHAEGLGAHQTAHILDDDLCRRLARDLAKGHIMVSAVPKASGRAVVIERREEDEEEDVATGPLPPKEEKHWIAIQVVDDESGKPLSGVPLEVKLPDGRAVVRKTGGDGTLHFSDLDPGTCSILKIMDDEALEVVAIE